MQKTKTQKYFFQTESIWIYDSEIRETLWKQVNGKQKHSKTYIQAESLWLYKQASAITFLNSVL